MALARAIVTRPDILLFDEPLSNLDAKLREKVRIEIRELQRRLGITTLYVTHDQAEALAISDRIVVMNGGRIEQIGDPGIDLPRAAQRASSPISSAPPTSSRRRAIGGGIVETPVGRFAVAGDAAAAAGAREAELAAGGHEARAPTAPATSAARASRSVVFRGNFTELLVEVAGQPLRAQVDSDLAVAGRRHARASPSPPTASGSSHERMQPGRLTLLLLILPGAGFIFLFLAAAIAMTFLQSIGLYSLVGESRLTGEYWLSLLDRTFLDSFLFSLKVGIGSAFGTLLLRLSAGAVPAAPALRRAHHRLDRQDPAVRAGAGGGVPDPQRAGLQRRPQQRADVGSASSTGRCAC